MASTLVLSGKPGIWSGQYPGTQPPNDDCTQEVLNLNDIDSYDRFLDLIAFKNEMLLFR